MRIFLRALILIEAAALPLVTTTGHQLLSATAFGGIYGETAWGHRDFRRLEEADDEAKTIGADQVIATDD